MTNEDKLDLVKRAFCNYIENISTLGAMVTFINNLSPDGAKTFLENRLDHRAQNYIDTATSATATAAEYSDLADEVAGL